MAISRKRRVRRSAGAGRVRIMDKRAYLIRHSDGIKDIVALVKNKLSDLKAVAMDKFDKAIALTGKEAFELLVKLHSAKSAVEAANTAAKLESVKRRLISQAKNAKSDVSKNALKISMAIDSALSKVKSIWSKTNSGEQVAELTE